MRSIEIMCTPRVSAFSVDLSMPRRQGPHEPGRAGPRTRIRTLPGRQPAILSPAGVSTHQTSLTPWPFVSPAAASPAK